MGYKIQFDDITSFQVSTQTTIQAWGESINSVNTAASDFIGDTNFHGQAITSIRTYLSEVHGTLLQTLLNLMNDYSASFLLYKDGYYSIDNDNHAVLPQEVFTQTQTELTNSRNNLQNQIDLLNQAKGKISDLVSYSGSSHTKTIGDYNTILTNVDNLDQAIETYENNHAGQDLVAFKELLAATKALITEYQGKTRNVKTYQAGDLGKLTSIERFANAYTNVANHLKNNAERIQEASKRDQARFDALAAEKRAEQGWINLALGIVTIAVGVAAIVFTAGAATPLVVGAWVVGGGTILYGASNVVESGQDIYLGNKGDITTQAVNPIRDTVFMGNNDVYHKVGQAFTIGSSILIPIGQTSSVARGLVEFGIGEAGAWGAGQVGYHGTRLLGGSETDAQRVSFVSSILGGFVSSSAASKFRLNQAADDIDAPLLANGSDEIARLREQWNVPSKETIAVGKTDVKGLEDFTFEGASPGVRKEAGLPSLDEIMPNRPIQSSGKIASVTRHAEEDVANQFVEAVNKAGLKPEEVTGILRIHQSNPKGVCPTCLSGLGNPNKASGIIKQLSEMYPNLEIRVTSEIVEGMKPNGRLEFVVKNGVYIK